MATIRIEVESSTPDHADWLLHVFEVSGYVLHRNRRWRWEDPEDTEAEIVIESVVEVLYQDDETPYCDPIEWDLRSLEGIGVDLGQLEQDLYTAYMDEVAGC